MTISKFWQLSIKAFFRAPQWEVAFAQLESYFKA
jgi:hypothetical protein